MKRKNALQEIIRLSSELNQVQDIDILLEKILSEARKIVNADAGSIYVRQEDKLIFSHVQNNTLQKRLPKGQKLLYSTFSIPINKGSLAGYVAATGEILNINDVYQIPTETSYHFDSFYDMVSNYKTHSVLTVPLQTLRGNIIGVLQIINALDADAQFTEFKTEDEPIILHFANIASMILERAHMTRALILRMIRMAELRDPKETGPHVNRVAAYAVEIYERWAKKKKIAKNIIERNRDIFRMAAMLHDVGKVGISDLILKKPDRLNEKEYEIMKRHAVIGAQLLHERQSEFDEIAADIALTHHENWDGSGYPGKIDICTGEPLESNQEGKAVPLQGEEIPIWGRIVALADVYDALSSRRVYKQAWDQDKVLEEIQSLSGKKFDPELVVIFFDLLDVIESIRKRYPDIEDEE